MPIIQFHLVSSAYPEAAIDTLLVDASHAFAAALYPELTPVPVERVRAIVCDIALRRCAVGGKLVSQGATPAPFFTCLTLVGRPRAQLDAMMQRLTDLTAHHLTCERKLVRGLIIPVDAEDWYIAGEPASAARAAELAQRNAGQAD
jgi:phenylpyruvate tautomerase PptA (4-oxalocrotonate tautomerase family)